MAEQALTPRERALAHVKRCSDELAEAREAYHRAIFVAKEMRIPNTHIARAAGRTEAAIRMWLKRKARP